jgi:NAD(P)-dependent dehydrogenase (short-subunit alcohol dehydrogenase family)
MGRLAGKAAIITGSASGIGEATAKVFAREGADLLLADWQDVRGEEVAAALRKDGAKATFVKTDVSKPEDVKAMIDAAVQKYARLDIIFNNAGIEGEMNKPTADCTLDNWHRVIAINLTGVFLGMKHAIPEMLKAGGGSIINTASIAGLIGFPGIPAYCAAKGGVVQLSKCAALEYAKQNIRINVICPGVIWTPMVERATGDSEEGRRTFSAMEPVGRMGTAEEVANVALFLASDESAFCTGAPFIVDGGYVAA